MLVPGAFSPDGGAGRFIAPGEYFADYRRELESWGCRVRTAVFPPDATIEERGLVLKDQVGRFRRDTGARTVVLVAHSQGGLDARFALRTLSLEGVDRLFTIGTPHHGTPVAEWTIRQREGRGSFVYWLLRLVGGYDLEALRFAGEMTPAFLEKWAAKFSPAPGVRYASARGVCRTACHWGLSWLGKRLGTSNGDGLVTGESQRFGDDLGEFDLDHLSEVSSDAEKRPERYRLLSKIRGLIEN
jgi:triacylglycerol lipase